MSTAAPSGPASTSGGLSDHMLRVIRGEVPQEEKEQHYDKSLQRWWSEYARRKNDEEEEHVADSLLYDERCHLPRTTPRPVFQTEGQVEQAPQQQQGQAAAQANGIHSGNGTASQ